MTLSKFGVSTASPRHGISAAEVSPFHHCREVQHRNGIHRVAPVEPLSARVFRLRIARGYSVYQLAREAGIFAGTIQGLESGKMVDKRVLPVLAVALGVPLCRLMCGEHDCAKRACVSREHLGAEAAEDPLRCEEPRHRRAGLPPSRVGRWSNFENPIRQTSSGR